MVPFVAAYQLLRRRLASHQRFPPSGHVPLWRLLAGEVDYLARRATREPASWGLPVLGAAVVALGLSEATPGPVAPADWRWLGALAAAGLVLIVRAALRRSHVTSRGSGR